MSYRASQLGDPDARSAVPSANLPTIAGAVAPCLRSIRTAHAGQYHFRVWFAARADSSVVLAMQRSSDNGSSWQRSVIVDDRDRGRRGCDRPAPGVFLDTRKGYLHLVYFLEGSDGAGVFFAHSMDEGRMFHSPVPVVYGNSPSAASVAANGDSVVVVFEDPNSTTARIGIVLSHTTGHIFEQRAQATPDDVQAVAPWVALDHGQITVWWKTPTAGGESTGDRVGYRTGTWR
ncbi:MAG: hypothetical protein ABR585_10690 [Gemmatimonadaceae bacterium]